MAKYWEIQDDVAMLRQPLVAGQVELAYPARGFSLAASKLAGVAILRALTGANVVYQAAEPLVEAYERGVDLVATYAQTPERGYRPQVYWRYVEATLLNQPAAGLELILSAQTSLLDSDPQTWVESTLPADAASEVAGERCLRLVRPRGLSVSYVEMIQPSDLALQATENENGLCTLRWQLFPMSLEKGVIRRGRVRGLFVPRANDEALAVAAFEAFVNSPLVLST